MVMGVCVGGWINDEARRLLCLTLPLSVSALVPGGHRQQSVRDLHGGIRAGCVVGAAGQCAGQTVSCSELGEPDGGGRGASCAQDACR